MNNEFTRISAAILRNHFTSASKTKVDTEELKDSCIMHTKSGNLDVVSSPFRENTRTDPSLNLWIWARWPSYLQHPRKKLAWHSQKIFFCNETNLAVAKTFQVLEHKFNVLKDNDFTVTRAQAWFHHVQKIDETKLNESFD